MIFLHRPAATRRTAQSGFTLVELLTATLLIGMLAVVAQQNSNSTESYKLDYAAGEVAAAIRYARGESMRGVDAYGVRLRVANQRVLVFRGIPDAGVLTADYSVYHPISRQLYEIRMGESEFGEIQLQRSNFWSDDCDRSPFVSFDTAGVPRCIDPLEVLLESSVTTLSIGGLSRTITIDGETGRVTVQ